MHKKSLILSVPMLLAVLILGGWFVIRDRNIPEESKKEAVIKENPAKNGENAPSSSVSETVIDTSNWKTYRNEKYGFEMKYPAEWVVFDDYPDHNQIFLSLPENKDFRVDGVMFSMGKAATLTPEEIIKSVPDGEMAGFGAILDDSRISLKGSVEGRKILQERAIGDRMSYFFLENKGIKYVIRSSEFMGGNPCKSCELVVKTLEFLK